MSTTHGKGVDHVINGGAVDSNLRKNEEEEEEEEREKEEEKEELLLPYLNEDIVTKIIVKTPAEARVNRLRYVCKPWYNLINNDPGMALYRLLSSKSPCLILQTQDRTSRRYVNSGITDEEASEIINDPTFTTCFIKMGMEGIDQEEYDLSTPFRKLFIKACANGLVLAIARPDGIYFSYSTALHYVVNPLTNQRLLLPLPQGINHFPELSFIFLPSTGEYKFVGITIGDLSRQYMHILTLSGGSGGTGFPCNNNVADLTWRLVETPPDKLSIPLAINEIFYWVRDTCEEDYIVSFDARAEKFYTTPHMFRRLRTKGQRKGGFIEMGGHLCFWHMAGRHSQVHSNGKRSPVYSKLGVWILVKDSFRREWTKQYSITMDLNFMRTLEDYGHVVLSFGNGEVIIFQNYCEKSLWAYNLKSNQWWKLGNNLKDNDWIKFCGFHVINNTLDLKSLFSTEAEVLDLRSLFGLE